MAKSNKLIISCYHTPRTLILYKKKHFASWVLPTWTFISETVLEDCVLKNFTRFTENLLCQSLFLIKLHAGKLQLLWKKRRQHWRFSVNLVKTFFLQNNSGGCFCSFGWNERFSIRMSYNYLHKISRHENHGNCFLLGFNLTEIKFHCGWYVLCKQCPKMKPFERKHLRVLLFHQNKDSKSKDQSKNEFDFISLAMKTIVNRIFS